LLKGLILLSFSPSFKAWANSEPLTAEQPVQSDRKSAELKSAGEMSLADSNSQYFQILGQFEQLNAAGQKEKLVTRSYFQSLSWIGRTACMNYVCGLLSLDFCRQSLQLGLSDEALVVRDHALRITISGSHFSALEKRTASEKVIGDPRNYRKGRPFWIVDRAREYLVADSGESARR
jgi:hypothetical protein